jgi:hypothetical protein
VVEGVGSEIRVTGGGGGGDMTSSLSLDGGGGDMTSLVDEIGGRKRNDVDSVGEYEG